MNVQQSILRQKDVLPTTQEQILEAAITCVKRWGIERVTLNDIAYEARVARSTVYSYYSNRDEVIRFALLQSAYSFGDKLFAYLTQFETASERTLEAVVYSMKILPDEPSLALISDPALSDMVRQHTLTTPKGLEIGTELFKAIMQDDKYCDEELKEMAECAIRFMLSLITMETLGERSEAELKGFIARRLLPSIGLPVPEEFDIYKSSK